MGAESVDGRHLLERAACPNEWEVLPNGRLGLPVQCKKRCVYLSTDGKTRLCEHGETASAISQYAAGSRVRPVDSACTCTNVDGLTTGRFKKSPQDWPGAPLYYDVLVARGAEEAILPGGRRARRLPHISGACPVFMLPCGNMRCRHGNSESTLRSIKKLSTNRRPCDCSLGGQSWRKGRFQTIVTQRAF